ncbi:hypothetical protein AFB00_17555 [Pseudonocardia sp. HH130630-07]|nr:hypothetical protein AFB00_17555 [Pseudonocardia sp. HH130630-07]
MGAERGRLSNPDEEAATEDAHALAERIARGAARMFETTITVTVHAVTRAELAEEVAAVQAVASSLLISARPTTGRALHAWQTGLPCGIDRVRTGRILDTASLAASFPFTSPDLPATAPGPGAVLYGENLHSSGLVWWNRWDQSNYNQTVIGSSGAGKSYLVKSGLLRELCTGTEVHVVDPDDEYVRMADAVGGTVIRAGAPGVTLNPLDLPVHLDHATGRRSAAPDALTRQRLAVQTFLSVALTADLTGDSSPAPGGPGALTALERAVLDAAITTAYTGAGITDDPHTWTRPAPLLTDLHRALLDVGTDSDAAGRRSTDPASPSGSGAELRADTDSGTTGGGATGVEVASVAAGLAARLSPFTSGAYAALFDGPSSVVAAGHLVVWSVRELPEALRRLGMLLVLDAVWRTVTHPHNRRPRVVVVDEAWTLLQHPSAARFLLRAAKSGRKHWAGLTLITQDVADVLGSELGRAVIANSGTQIVLRQSAEAIDDVARACGLSGGEARFVRRAGRGEALLVAGPTRVALSAVVSPTEDALITTDPRQLTGTAATGGDWIDLDRPPAPRPAAPSPPASRAAPVRREVADPRVAGAASGAADLIVEGW